MIWLWKECTLWLLAYGGGVQRLDVCITVFIGLCFLASIIFCNRWGGK